MEDKILTDLAKLLVPEVKKQMERTSLITPSAMDEIKKNDPTTWPAKLHDAWDQAKFELCMPKKETEPDTGGFSEED